MSSLILQLDSKDAIRKFTEKTLNNVLRKSLIRTLNRMSERGKTKANRLIRERYKLKASQVSRYLNVQKAKSASDNAFIIASGTRIPFALFSFRQVKVRSTAGPRKGVKVNRFGSFDFIQGGFLATSQKGKIGIFRRKRKSRFPIKELFSSSVKSIFASNAVQSKLRPFVETEGVKQFETDFKFFASKELKGKI